MIRSNHTQVPNELMDRLMSELKGSELKVFLCICRKTIGWHKETDEVSISQLMDMTGLSNRCVIDATKSLENKGLLACNRRDRRTTIYEIAYEESSQDKDKLVKKVHKGSEESSQVACEESSHTKETIKETITKDSVATSSSEFPDSCEYLNESKEIANFLKDSIIDWDPSHKYASNPPTIRNWVLEIERAIRLDNRTPEQLRFIIEYIYTQRTSTANFWAGNIESGKKIREHFDKIKNQIKRETNYDQRSNIQSVVDSLYRQTGSSN